MSQLPLRPNPNSVMQSSLSPRPGQQRLTDYNHELVFHKVLNGITGVHLLQHNLRNPDPSKDQFSHSPNSVRLMINPPSQQANNAPYFRNNSLMEQVRYQVFEGDTSRQQNQYSSVNSGPSIPQGQRSLLDDKQMIFPDKNPESMPHVYASFRYQHQDSRGNAFNMNKRQSSPVPSISQPRDTTGVHGLPLPIKTPARQLQSGANHFARKPEQSSSMKIQHRSQTPDLYSSVDRRLLESQTDKRTVSQEPLFNRLDSELIVVETFSIPETVVQKPKQPKIFDGDSEKTKFGRLVQANRRGSQNPTDIGNKSIDLLLSDVSDLKLPSFFPQPVKENLSKTMPLPTEMPHIPEKEIDFTPNIFQKLRLLEKELITLKAINEQKTIEMRAMAQKLGCPTTELKTLLDDRAQKHIQALTEENRELRQRIQELEDTLKLVSVSESKKKGTSLIADLKAQILILEKEKIEIREKYENFKKIATNGTYEDLERSLIRIRELEDYVKRLKRKNELVDARKTPE
jgi:hypothetical protein